VLGEDFWPEGMGANWPNVATLMEYAREQGLIDRLFAEEDEYADGISYLERKPLGCTRTSGQGQAAELAISRARW